MKDKCMSCGHFYYEHYSFISDDKDIRGCEPLKENCPCSGFNDGGKAKDLFADWEQNEIQAERIAAGEVQIDSEVHDYQTRGKKNEHDKN